MPLSKEHKRKISKGLIKYHKTCKAKKPKSDIDKEINRLKKKSDKITEQNKKKNLQKEISKLKNMIR